MDTNGKSAARARTNRKQARDPRSQTQDPGSQWDHNNSGTFDACKLASHMRSCTGTFDACIYAR